MSGKKKSQVLPPKQCAICKIKLAMFDKAQNKYLSDYCKQCNCKELGCAKRATHEAGFCDEHFKTSLAETTAETGEVQFCQRCLKNSHGKLYCGSCAPLVPYCNGEDCRLKCLLNKRENKYFAYCQHHKCVVLSCNRVRNGDEDGTCGACPVEYKCADCKAELTTIKYGPKCFTCQHRCQQCNEPSGYHKNDLGQIESNPFCRSCRCEEPKCPNAKCDGPYCEACNSKKPYYCSAKNCNKRMAKNVEYCQACERAWKNGKMECCPEEGCSGYKLPFHEVCPQCHKATLKVQVPMPQGLTVN